PEGWPRPHRVGSLERTGRPPPPTRSPKPPDGEERGAERSDRRNPKAGLWIRSAGRDLFGEGKARMITTRTAAVLAACHTPANPPTTPSAPAAASPLAALGLRIAALGPQQSRASSRHRMVTDPPSPGGPAATAHA